MKLEMVPIQGKEKTIFSNFRFEQVNPYNAQLQQFPAQAIGSGGYRNTTQGFYYYGSAGTTTNGY